MSTVKDMASGAVGGLAGGLVMSAAMLAGKKAGIVPDPLPHRVERWVEETAGVADETTPQQEMALAQGGHLVYAAALGAGYGAARSPLHLPAIPTGPLFGLGIYALNLGAVGPALELTAGPWSEPPATVGRRVMMHAMYGMVTALVAEKLGEQAAPSQA